MLYQKLLSGEKPYMVCGNSDSVNSFAEHRHPEAEFVYCRRGSLKVTIERTEYTVHAGQLAVIAPMAAHAYSNPADAGRETLVIEVGPALLHSFFEALRFLDDSMPVKTLDDGTDGIRRLRLLLDETLAEYSRQDDYAELLLEGSVQKICAYILREFSGGAGHDRRFRDVANIEKALSLIHNRFAEPITVEDAAAVTGYGKSNFCKIFKNITGETFHGALNRRRVENACFYLRETAVTVTDIAPLTGFSDAKTLCRVFKAVTGMSPGQYRAAGRESDAD